MTFFTLIAPQTIWGDYDYTLSHGLAERDLRSGLLNIKRTAPFIPPISFPGIEEIVVTDEFRVRLEESGLSGFKFLPVIKQHIVESRWHEWDKDAEEPALYPDEGEPESYILNQPHSEKLALELSVLWEMEIEKTARIERITYPCGLLCREYYVLADSWRGSDLFRASDVCYNFVTEKAKTWFENEVPESVNFAFAPTK